jgi:dipeptidyl aminopeptidase/acylaminoacyl peptidase
MRLPHLLLPLAALLLPDAADAGGKKPVQIEDLYRLEGPKAVTLFPDGQKAAYVRTWIDPVRKLERTSLWLADGSKDRCRPLENDQLDAHAPVIAPNGKWIAFLSTRPRPTMWRPLPATPPESDPAVDIWIMPVAGGPPLPLAGPRKAYGRVFNDGFYGRVAFSPDGRRVVFVADDGMERRTPEEYAGDVQVARADQGEGYTGYGPAQVWVAYLDDNPRQFHASRIERLTNDDIWYGDPQWSPDGKTIVVHANKTNERESVRYSINRNFDLWALDAASGKQRQLTKGPGPEVSPRFAPDGQSLACLSIPRQGSHRDVFNLAIVSLTAEEPAQRVVFDHHAPGADKSSQLPPAFPLPDDCWQDAKALFYNADDRTTSRVVRLDLKTGKGSSAEPAKPGSEHGSAERRARRAQLTPALNPFLSERLVAPSKVVTWQSDGMTIEGILTLPPDAAAKAPYKLLVHPHGGPHSRSTVGFDFTVQVFAAQGYAVLQPNFRGSAGYGQKFIDADRFDFGGGDARDILTGIESLVKEGVVDKNRQFLYGTSYGGYMTTWLVGQTPQFRAAVAQNAVTDLTMMWALSDLQSWTQWEFGGPPWAFPERYQKHSPLAHVAKVRTPTLLLHARDDRRCPLPMGKAYYQALLTCGVPTQLVIYPKEGHGIRQPRHREDVLRRVLAWFEKQDP